MSNLALRSLTDSIRRLSTMSNDYILAHVSSQAWALNDALNSGLISQEECGFLYRLLNDVMESTR
jgi:hypothetical protein